jgi:hypothetical protein
LEIGERQSQHHLQVSSISAIFNHRFAGIRQLGGKVQAARYLIRLATFRRKNAFSEIDPVP